MDAPFVGTPVVGPDLNGKTTEWAVISSHPVVVGFGEGRAKIGGWVAWLMAPNHPMLCVGDQGFAPQGEGQPAAYRVLVPA